MDEKTFAALYVSEKVLINPKPYPQFQILQEENCFNPLIVILRVGNSTMEISAIEYNRAYFNPLTNLRKAIESGNLESVINALFHFYHPAFAFNDEQNFVDFLTFRGMFYNCQWFENTNSSDYPQDLICTEEEKPLEIKLKPFLKHGECPKNKLLELFDGMEDVKTEEIGGLKYENPFSDILCVNFYNGYQAFDNAIECLTNNKFIPKWQEQQNGLKKNQPTNGTVAPNSEQAGSKEWLTARNKMLPLKIRKALKLPYNPNDKTIPEAIARLPFKNNAEKTIFMDRYTSHWTQKNRAEAIGTSETAYSRDRKK